MTHLHDVGEMGLTAEEKELVALRNRVRELEAHRCDHYVLAGLPGVEFCRKGGARIVAEQLAAAKGLTFARFRAVNVARAKSFPSAKQGWTPADWMVALMGEVGELAATLIDERVREEELKEKT